MRSLETREAEILDKPCSIQRAEQLTKLQRTIDNKVRELMRYYSDNRVHGNAVGDFGFMEPHNIELHEQIIVELGYWRYQ